jgi:hypothetical protein
LLLELLVELFAEVEDEGRVVFAYQQVEAFVYLS